MGIDTQTAEHNEAFLRDNVYYDLESPTPWNLFEQSRCLYDCQGVFSILVCVCVPRDCAWEGFGASFRNLSGVLVGYLSGCVGGELR